MKSRANHSRTVIFLLAALAFPIGLAAQQHARYKLIDLGTLGVPHSYGSVNGEGFQLLNNSGEGASYTDLNAFVWEEAGPTLDLNTLIPPGSGYQLTTVFNINDRGEILPKSAPLGLTANDDADLGHLVLLVPCDSPDVDCAMNAADTTSVAPQNAARSTNSLTAATSHASREHSCVACTVYSPVSHSCSWFRSTKELVLHEASA